MSTPDEIPGTPEGAMSETPDEIPEIQPALTRGERTVWAIEQGSYSDYQVVGVYSSKEAAEEVVARVDPDPWATDLRISEWPLNPGLARLNAGRWLYRVEMERDGTAKVQGLYPASVEEGRGGDSGDYVNSPRRWFRVWAKDREHAVKVANEHRTRMIAEGNWPPKETP